MTLTIDLAPEQEARLREMAALRGVRPEEYERLAASVLAHGISHLFTFSAADFARYPGITAVHPRAI